LHWASRSTLHANAAFAPSRGDANACDAPNPSAATVTAENIALRSIFSLIESSCAWVMDALPAHPVSNGRMQLYHAFNDYKMQ
jgi:hypothetical protein